MSETSLDKRMPLRAAAFRNAVSRPGDHRLASIDWAISNKAVRASMTGPGLIVHLIAAHGFFEGAGSPYRVDPRALAALLAM